MTHALGGEARAAGHGYLGKREVLHVLNHSPQTVSQVAAGVGLSVIHVRRLLRALHHDGHIVRLKGRPYLFIRERRVVSR